MSRLLRKQEKPDYKLDLDSETENEKKYGCIDPELCFNRDSKDLNLYQIP